MNKFHLIGCTLCLYILLLSTSVNAALVSVAGGLAYYDEEQDITWIANANLAASNTFGLSYDTDLGNHPGDTWASNYTEQILSSNGSMNWGAALWWIDAMNNANYLGASTWRLPSTLVPDATCDGSSTSYGFNCTGSEMGYLYYAHGITASSPGVFSNVMGTGFNRYWSGTEYATNDEYAYILAFSDGYQDAYNKYVTSDGNFAWAVLDGNIDELTAVPLPAAAWLFGSGLLGLVSFVRRKKAA